MRDTKPFNFFFFLLYKNEIVFHLCALIYLREEDSQVFLWKIWQVPISKKDIKNTRLVHANI